MYNHVGLFTAHISMTEEGRGERGGGGDGGREGGRRKGGGGGRKGGGREEGWGGGRKGERGRGIMIKNNSWLWSHEVMFNRLSNEALEMVKPTGMLACLFWYVFVAG